MPNTELDEKVAELREVAAGTERASQILEWWAGLSDLEAAKLERDGDTAGSRKEHDKAEYLRLKIKVIAEVAEIVDEVADAVARL